MAVDPSTLSRLKLFSHPAQANGFPGGYANDQLILIHRREGAFHCR